MDRINDLFSDYDEQIEIGNKILSREEAVSECEKTEQEIYVELSKLCENIYKQVYDTDFWHQYEGQLIEAFIDSTIMRINQLIKKQKKISEFVLFNKDKSKCIINTGILSKNHTYIKVILGISNGMLDLYDRKIYKGKVSAEKLGFDASKITELERVRFIDSLSELMCDIEEEKLDLDNTIGVVHILAERRWRLPDNIKDLDNTILSRNIIDSVKLGVKLNKASGKYIKPIYVRSKDRIDFAVPLIYNDIPEECDDETRYIIITEVKGYWQIKTILRQREVACNSVVFKEY